MNETTKEGAKPGTWIAVGLGLLLVVGIAACKQKPEEVAVDGKAVQVRKDLSTLTTALKGYQAEGGRFPSTAQGLKALVEKPETGPQPSNWQPTLESELIDPWGNPYGYHWSGKGSGKKFPEIFSSGPDGAQGTKDDIGNWDDNALGP